MMWVCFLLYELRYLYSMFANSFISMCSFYNHGCIVYGLAVIFLG
jgi:hypothetical protein